MVTQESHGVILGLGSAGFHYTRAELDKMEDPEEARAKRGAHWTFNGPAFVQAISDLKKAGLPSRDLSFPLSMRILHCLTKPNSQTAGRTAQP